MGAYSYGSFFGSPILKTAVSAPLTTTTTLGGGALGGWAVDKASKALTGRSIGDNVAKYTSLSSDMGEMFNPGYGGISRGLAIGDALTTAITGKSRSWMKPLVREYLGKPYYANIRPSGYGNSDPFGGPSRNRQYFNMFVDFLKPTFLRENVNDPNYRPKWMADRNNPTVYEIFRNDAHRLSMGLKPHQELLPDNQYLLPDNQYHSLYIKKPDGKYDVDWWYINHAKQKYPDKDNFVSEHTLNLEESSDSFNYLKGSNPSDGKVISFDHLTTNGGYGTYTFDPKDVYVNPNSNGPTHATNGDITFTDTWDVQPLIDKRSAFPWISKSLTKVADKKVPIISKLAQNLKNVELVDAFGGTPFTQESKLPRGIIYWYPSTK